MTSGTDRRDFLKWSAAAGLGAAALSACSKETYLGAGPRQPYRDDPIDEVRVGIVGVGGMGSAHAGHYLKVPGCRIVAVCDLKESRVARIQDWTEAAGFPRPRGYSRGPTDYERLCGEEDLDLVFTATPWNLHVPICVEAMKAGKHAATEVPAAVTMDECWELVEAAEGTRRHCQMMENVCYGRSEMMVLNMVRKGLLGELLNAQCGYLHDLRGVKYDMNGEGVWRREHSVLRDGNLYPTHGLGPVAQCMNINRGARFTRIVSMSSPSRGLQEYRDRTRKTGDPLRDEEFRLGDVNTSIIQTAKGRTITVIHDTNLPRPYSRVNLVQGTKGLVEGFPDRIHIEGRSPGHGWEKFDGYREEFEHPLWRADETQELTGGHGGMDRLEVSRLVHCLRGGLPTEQDVYDAAAWSAVGPLSEASVAAQGEVQDFPDFTRGRWRTWPALAIVGA